MGKYFIIMILLIAFSKVIFGQGKVVLYETFDTNINKWDLKDDESGSVKILGGFMRAENREGTMMINKMTEFNKGEDFTVEASITPEVLKESGSYGIIWGYNDSKNYFAFEINKKSGFCISKVQNDNRENIKDWTQIGNLNTEERSNKLCVKRYIDRWEFLVNDAVAFSKEAMILEGTGTGVILNGAVKVSIDYLKVWENKSGKQSGKHVKQNLGLNVNSPHQELHPLISADGKILFIVRHHPQNVGGEEDQDIWFSRLENGKWTKMKNIGEPLNNKASNGVISISPDGNSMLISNQYNRDGSYSGSGISRSTKTSNGWSVPENVEIENYVNRNQYHNFCLSSDNLSLILAVQRDDSYGEQDLYVSFKTNNGFSEPKNLGKTINTSSTEMSPFFASDNVTLYFSSKGHGGYGVSDIFVTKRLDDTWTNWSKPENLGSEINGAGWDAYYTIPASGDVAYLVSSENSFGSGDIFKMVVPEKVRPEPVVLISGRVVNATTNEPVHAGITFNDLSTNKLLGTALSDPTTGEYKIVLPFGKRYSFLAKKENFFSISDNIDLTSLTKYEEISRDLLLSPIEVGGVVRMNNIFFDVDKWDLKPESYAELERVIEMLSSYNSMQISIHGHTDSDGTDEHNMELSEARAKSVLDYLLKKGISLVRLSSLGFGETKPTAPNTTEGGKALNRRVEFVIDKK